jgi:hypothetical protein
MYGTPSSSIASFPNRITLCGWVDRGDTQGVPVADRRAEHLFA